MIALVASSIVTIRIQIGALAQPCVFRAVLKQHHPRQRTPLALAPVHPAPGSLGRQPPQLQHALHQTVRPPERLAVRHRLAHDLLVEVLGCEIEIPRPKHLRQPLRFRVRNPRPTHPSSPMVDQPLLATILVGVPQPTEMTLAQSQQLPSFHATQSSCSMRPYRIQNTRHPNLRQHRISRSKTGQTTRYLIRTYHLLPTRVGEAAMPHPFQRAMLIHVFSVLRLRPLSEHRSPQIPAAARMRGIKSSTCV